MTSTLRIAALVLVGLPILSAEARDGQPKPMSPRERVAREAAERFSARMSRLDALMGGVPRSAEKTRARSANAEH